MREFFRGWRRKVGCVTLLMALAVFGMWTRSQLVWEMINAPVGGRDHVTLLVPGRFTWVSYFPEKGNRIPQQWDQDQVSKDNVHGLEEMEAEWRQDSMRRPGYIGVRVNLLVVLIPLSLLSAYLILWKPRKQSGHA